MDKLKDMVGGGGFNPADLQKYTQGVSWPIGKDDLAAVMKQKGAPDGVVSKVQGSDATEFKDQNDLMSKISM
ncbi:MAG: DUF2795 domain-containing protein [Chloroflexota bacterium]|nr:DUF2795 domain-containing protein [Chloroflexota bacterium]